MAEGRCDQTIITVPRRPDWEEELAQEVARPSGWVPLGQSCQPPLPLREYPEVWRLASQEFVDRVARGEAPTLVGPRQCGKTTAIVRAAIAWPGEVRIVVLGGSRECRRVERLVADTWHGSGGTGEPGRIRVCGVHDVIGRRAPRGGGSLLVDEMDQIGPCAQSRLFAAGVCIGRTSCNSGPGPTLYTRGESEICDLLLDAFADIAATCGGGPVVFWHRPHFRGWSRGLCTEFRRRLPHAFLCSDCGDDCQCQCWASASRPVLHLRKWTMDSDYITGILTMADDDRHEHLDRAYMATPRGNYVFARNDGRITLVHTDQQMRHAST
jgi:hypothetical protein